MTNLTDSQLLSPDATHGLFMSKSKIYLNVSVFNEIPLYKFSKLSLEIILDKKNQAKIESHHFIYSNLYKTFDPGADSADFRIVF